MFVMLPFWQLFHLGHEYPDPNYQFSKRVHGCFVATGSQVRTDEELQKAIEKAEFIKKEVEALIFLKKYRQSRRAFLYWLNLRELIHIHVRVHSEAALWSIYTVA